MAWKINGTPPNGLQTPIGVERSRIALEVFEETYRLLFEANKVRFNFTYQEETFQGPKLVNDKRHKHLHRAIAPLSDDRSYWIPVSSFLYSLHNYRHASFYFSDEEKLDKVNKESLFKEFLKSTQFQYVIYLLIQFAKIYPIRELKGPIGKETLSLLLKPEGIVLNCVAFEEQFIESNEETLNLSIF